MLEFGDVVRYKGGRLPWSGQKKKENIGRLARIVMPVEGSQYFLGRWDIDLCIEWLDSKPSDLPCNRFSMTSSSRVELVKKECTNEEVHLLPQRNQAGKESDCFL